MTRNLDVPDEYAALYRVYEDAYEQASRGKGKERHAEDGEPYERQIICEVARRVGLGYPLGQAVKKIYESQRIGGERGVAELLGAINYIAAAIIVMREGLESVPKAEGNCSQNGNSSPEFKPGDRVQYHVTLPSVSDGMWVDAEYDGKLTNGREHTVKTKKLGLVVVDGKDIRPAPKAEGCEALVEQDAPQTPEEVCRRIVDSNPATYGHPHNPTGEELAEMAREEDADGGV